jgi:GT2 family glycosyltransferase/glycosyltransferase involved in cell wall biosynthesis
MGKAADLEHWGPNQDTIEDTDQMEASQPRSDAPTGLGPCIKELQDRYWQVLTSLRNEERVHHRYVQSHHAIAAEARRSRADAQHWQARYSQLEHSLAVRMMGRYRAELERLAPTGSTRRSVYGRAVSTGRRLAQRSGASTPGVAPLVAPAVPVVPMALQPDVSIVIPVHNQWALTAGCLVSIATDLSAVGFEVIVVDDASTDETADELAEVVGVNAVSLDQNEGFIAAVNAGIAVARGRFIVLLNNDTICAPGWLDALVGTAELDETIGVVGAKLVYPDGLLQEAGGIIWNDASGHNYGRHQDPNDPRYGFVRDVDYCSGACLLVRRELMIMLGGLDSRFSPAYYEDTDLCFAARSHGYRVVYQPAAVVCHLEGASNGTDVTTGIKAYQVTNQEKFRAKWADALARQGDPAPASPRLTAWRAPAGRALVIDHQLPMPDQDSGSHRMVEVLKILCDLGLGVTFVPNNGITIPRYRESLLALGVEVLGGPGDLDPYLADIGPDLRVVVLSRPTVAWANYPMIRSLVPETTIVYDTVDLHYLRELGRAELEGGAVAKQSADFHYGMELSLAKLCDQTWTVSPTERTALLADVPDLRVEVVPNVHRDEAPGPGFDQREGILFVGNYAHLANRDAAHFLVDQVLPLVRAELPEVAVHLVGSNITEEISALAGEGVIVHGWVPDVEDIYRRVRLSAAPLRFGAGQKGKVGESLAFGVPVVTTPIGAQGFVMEHGRDALVGVSATELAALLVKAYRDPDLWAELSSNGRQRVSEDFSPASVRRTLGRILTDLGIPVVS